MQTEILPEFMRTPEGREADAILRSCVHCGFCTATCPTYQLLGDELDGPRGRIYQIKLVLEGQTPTRVTQQHLDRCLTCRACETTCPSGVRYARLAEIGRHLVEERVERPFVERLLRKALIGIVPYPTRFGPLMRLARLVAPLLPATLKAKVTTPRPPGDWPAPTGRRRVLALAGCVQSVSTPLTNAAAARILSRLGIDLRVTPEAGCCGAAAYHLSDREAGLAAMRRNIDAWWPEIESGCEAILIAASGCGAMVKEYGEALAHDPDYAAKAARVAALARDPAEILGREDLSALGAPGQGRRVAFHSPCTLQHGQQLKQVVEPILMRLGFTMTSVPDGHLCCGSAGTYSITQPALSEQLRRNKIAALESETPEVIATANIGCQLHLEAGTTTPVVHWLELLDRPEAESA
ncbi:glycolate oxidase subunit GlcF [Thiocystis violascens]|uniref:Glycolate oxidase iron-sulfur subunit n=1 Tax=Thiocystis violascens (strain ATCC 17096 / DSM 198 / 6111) TaxID=765911 RepID=I3Y6W1_THIV6|nr:glycolate oxidase subunit GlcF [Thiocystis violascens]AFL72729.1 Fe-S oxidoreductase [Thiocystis violascens DSM 198]